MFEWAGSEFNTFMRQFPQFKEQPQNPLNGGGMPGVDHMVYSDGKLTFTFTSTADFMRMTIKKGNDIVKNQDYFDFPTVKDDVKEAIEAR